MDVGQRFFDRSDDGLLVYDRSLRIVGANAAAARFFRVPAPSLPGTLNAQHAPGIAAALDPLLAEAFSTGSAAAGRLAPFDMHDVLRVNVRAHGQEAMVVLHRIADDLWDVEEARLRQLEIAKQLLTFHTEHSPLAVIRSDAQFRIVGWSPRAQALFGRSFTDVYGKTFEEIGLVDERDRESVAGVKAEIQSGAVDGNVSEHRNVTPDGRVLHCRWFNSHVKTADGFGILSLVEDVTESVAARAHAEESEQRFRSLFEYSPEPMLVLSLEGIIMRANRAAGERHEVPLSAMVGRSVADFIAGSDAALASEALHDAANGNARSVELTALRGAGTYPIAASLIPIVLDGRVAGVHLIARDLSEAKLAAGAIASQAQRIRELYIVAAAANSTAERQIVATIETGCRLLGMRSGSLYDRESDRAIATVGSTVPPKLTRLALATDGALAIEDLRSLPYIGEAGPGEPAAASYIGTPIDVSGSRYGSLSFSDTAPRIGGFPAVDRDLVQLMGGLVGSALERGRARARLKHLAYNDQLTSLPNRASFVERLKEALTAAALRRSRVAVMFLDLDRFKDVNDTLGHTLGDRLLRTIGERLAETVGADGVVARHGGDEFIIMFSQDPSSEHAAALAERIIAAIDQAIEIEGYEQFLTTSVGISMYPNDGGDADTLMKHADVAMYRAKERGRNTYQFFTPALNASLRTRISQEKSLRKALDRGEFVVFYQPQIDLATERIVSVEALVRWQHPRLGLVGPLQFIPSAERSGLIVALGDWILQTACAQVRSWQLAGFPDLRLAVNLSARQFHQHALADKIAATVARTQIAPGSVELEITESVAMSDATLSIAIMKQLRDSGIRLSVDDFGTGYSSLGYLRRFPLHSIKIDQSFVRDVTTEPDDATIVKTVIGMAHSLGLEVVAEGVETAAQLEFLRREQCDRVQGYYYARPAAADDVTELLEAAGAETVQTR
ncbi:MAG: EAL domain-containing protein [Candidatus Velthaea sp.]